MSGRPESVDGADPELGEVERLERRLLDPDVRSDPALMRASMHPDFREFGASGTVWEREAILARLAQEPRIDGQVGYLETVRLAEDVVLVTFRLTGPARTTLRSSVWVRDGGTWRMRFHQGTVTDG